MKQENTQNLFNQIDMAIYHIGLQLYLPPYPLKSAKQAEFRAWTASNVSVSLDS